jgi:hypothetical protein
MEKNSLSLTQVFAVSSVEAHISAFTDNPEDYFKKITDLIDEHKITEHKEMMIYLYELLLRKAGPEYIAEFRKKYQDSIEGGQNDFNN